MVVSQAAFSMEVDSNILDDGDLVCGDAERCHHAVTVLKGYLIGSNKHKYGAIERGVVPRLVNIIGDSGLPQEVRLVATHSLGSIAKGPDDHIKVLIQADAVSALVKCLTGGCDDRLVEAALSCLKTVYMHPEAPMDCLYSDPGVMPRLISLASGSVRSQIAAANILIGACKTREHQTILASHGAVDAICLLLCSPHEDVRLPALQFLAYLMYGENSVVATLVVNASYRNRSLLGLVVSSMARDQKDDIQLAAAQCLTYLYRAGKLEESDPRIVYKALPCLVRMTGDKEPPETRIMAAETLAVLIELSPELQRIAAISNHLITTLEKFLKWESGCHIEFMDIGEESSPSPLPAPKNGNVEPAASHLSNTSLSETHFSPDAEDLGAYTKFQMMQMSRKAEQRANQGQELKRAAFRVFACLAANDEDIRKRVIGTKHLMESLVASIDENSPPKLQMAAVSCLHSMSRSVQLLRTTFHDHPVWKPLMKILTSPVGDNSVDFMVIASSTLCNLLLEFCPSKEPILESGAIDLLCNLTHKYDSNLVLNGVWGLMNMAFQSSQRVKVQIITTLGSDQIFRLLADQDIDIVMKTLGLLRNLLSTKGQTDHVMNLYGKQIMQAVVFILEGDKAADVKEQALCILANIADGDAAKSYIMSNEDVLKKITNYVIHTNSKLQMAAVLCVHNLVFIEEQGAHERQAKLKEMGVLTILQQLLTTDSDLYEKLKSTLQQFA